MTQLLSPVFRSLPTAGGSFLLSLPGPRAGLRLSSTSNDPSGAALGETSEILYDCNHRLHCMIDACALACFCSVFCLYPALPSMPRESASSMRTLKRHDMPPPNRSI